MTDPIETRRRFYAEELRFTTRGEFSAQFLCAAAFYEFSGARDPDVGSRLEQALTRDRGTGVKSLRRDLTRKRKLAGCTATAGVSPAAR